MYEFDVDYLNEEYMEYYKDVLITRKIVRNIVFVLIFVAIAVVYWVDKSDATKGNFVPIASLVAAVILPCSNLLYIPLLKRQLKLREQEVKSIHIHLTFEDDKIIYENKTEALPKVEEEKPELVEENPSSAEEIVEEDSEFERINSFYAGFTGTQDATTTSSIETNENMEYDDNTDRISDELAKDETAEETAGEVTSSLRRLGGYRNMRGSGRSSGRHF